MIHIQKKLLGVSLAVLFLCEICFFVISAEKTLRAESAVPDLPAGVSVTGGAVSGGSGAGQPVSDPRQLKQRRLKIRGL